MNREDFIKFIPKPENKDVIIYDMSLQDLIDIDVLQEYNKLYPVFISKKEQYINLKAKLEEYNKIIDKVYLFKRNWVEEDYLQALKNDKKTYSILYGDIKKIENNISMLQRNLKGINEKIQIQESKENKKIEDKNDTLEKDIEKNKEKLLNHKNFLDSYNLALKEVNDRIQENQREFDDLCFIEKRLQDEQLVCPCCGSKIKTTNKNSAIFKRTYENIEKNKNKLEKLLEQQNKLELNIAYYEDEIKKIKSDLNNNIQFKKENKNVYQKKSLEVLKLEALKDELLNNIAKYEKELKSNEKTKSAKFIELKSNIEKYELSLNNIKKIRELKEENKSEMKEFTNLRKELKEMLDKLNLYLKFIEIYFKILQQKAEEYCGKDFKFKFARIEEYQLIPILEIYYKGLKYEELNPKDAKEIEKYLIEKFSIYL